MSRKSENRIIDYGNQRVIDITFDLKYNKLSEKNQDLLQMRLQKRLWPHSELYVGHESRQR